MRFLKACLITTVILMVTLALVSFAFAIKFAFYIFTIAMVVGIFLWVVYNLLA